jgi:hypothetical protein
MTVITSPTSATGGDLAQARRAAVEAHEAARAAWDRTSTAADVTAARRLSRAAVRMACIDAFWMEELNAACLDCETEHAADLHAQAADHLRFVWAHPHPPLASR